MERGEFGEDFGEAAVECADDDSNGEMLAVKEKRLGRERRTFWRPSLVVERV